jgi:hypothetical protein
MKKNRIAALIIIALILMACNFPLLPKIKLPGFIGEITIPSMSTIQPMLTLSLPALMKSLEPQITLPAAGTNQPPSIKIPGMPTQAYKPEANDGSLARKELTLSLAEVIYPDTSPTKPVLHIVGSLTNSCEKLRAVVAKPDSQKRVLVDVYSLVDAKGICLPVGIPLDQYIDFGDLPAGPFTVWVANKQVGTIK